MNNRGKTPISLAIDYIKKQDPVGLSKVLSLIDLTPIKELDMFRMASIWLETAEKFGSIITVPLILQKFQVWDKLSTQGSALGTMESQINFMSRIMGQNMFTDTNIVFVINALREIIKEEPEYAEQQNIQDYGYEDLLDDLMMIGRVQWVFDSLNRAERVFGEQTNDFYKAYYELLKEKGEEYLNADIGQFITERYTETNDYAPVPEWIHNYEEGDVPGEDEYDMDEINDEFEERVESELHELYENTSVDELIRRATDGFKNLGVDSQSLAVVKKTLEKELKAKNTDLDTVLGDAIGKEIQRQMVTDLGLFRLYGPAHPIVNQDLDTDSNSDKFGGCRLFLCDIFDYDEETDQTDDWFTGSCDFCHRRIRIRWHAVRIPKLTGGWKGCYCSWNHVRDDLVHSELVVLPLIDIFEKTMIEKGIQDRHS